MVCFSVVTQRSSPFDQLKIKYNKAWLNTNLAKTQTEKHIASIHGSFTFTCIHTLRLQKRGFLYIRNGISPGVTPYLGSECSFVFFLNRLTANERAPISRALLEMEQCGAIRTTAYLGSITSRCSVNEPALLLLLGRTEIEAEIEPG